MTVVVLSNFAGTASNTTFTIYTSSGSVAWFGSTSESETDEYSTLYNTVYYIRSSKPVLVAQFALSSQIFLGTGDPFMVFLPPLDRPELLSSDYRFITPPTSTGLTYGHFINVVISSANTVGLMVNCKTVTPTWTTISTIGYSTAQIKIPAGSSSIIHASGKLFAAYMYGSTISEAYAMALTPWNSNLTFSTNMDPSACSTSTTSTSIPTTIQSTTRDISTVTSDDVIVSNYNIYTDDTDNRYSFQTSTANNNQSSEINTHTILPANERPSPSSTTAFPSPVVNVLSTIEDYRNITTAHIYIPNTPTLTTYKEQQLESATSANNVHSDTLPQQHTEYTTSVNIAHPDTSTQQQTEHTTSANIAHPDTSTQQQTEHTTSAYIAHPDTSTQQHTEHTTSANIAHPDTSTEQQTEHTTSAYIAHLDTSTQQQTEHTTSANIAHPDTSTQQQTEHTTSAYIAHPDTSTQQQTELTTSANIAHPDTSTQQHTEHTTSAYIAHLDTSTHATY